MSFGSSLNIPRLPEEKQLAGEENWRPYKWEILFAVQSRGLTGYIEGTIPKPNSYLQPIYPAVQATTTPWSSPTPFPEEWDARDRLVAGTIISNITDPVRLGIDETKWASEIWTALVKRFKKQDEQRIHLADTSLCQEKFDPAESTMEDHEKRMRNLIKKVHDLGGTVTDTQFRHIVISSMPPEWRQDVRSMPGNSSADAFTYFHTLWYEKEEERREDEHDTKRVKALMMAHSNNFTNNQMRNGGKLTITCHNCSKPGHITRKCWAKGGGMEGQWPKQGQAPRNKTEANAANPDNNDVVSPLATYVMSSQVDNRSSMFKSVPKPQLTTDPATRQSHSILEKTGQREAGSKDVDSNIVIPRTDCTACHSNTHLYALPMPSIKTFIDSGASEHCWVSRADFIEYTEVKGQGGSSAISGEAGRFEIAGTGTVQFVTCIGTVERTIQLRGVKHTPSFGHNLISLSMLDMRGMKGEWGQGVMSVRAQNGETAGGVWKEQDV